MRQGKIERVPEGFRHSFCICVEMRVYSLTAAIAAANLAIGTL